jgi:hypothetical protein
MTFLNLNTGSNLRSLIEQFHNAADEGGTGWILSPSGKKIETTDTSGQKKCRLDVSLPCTLYLLKKPDGRTGWTIKVEEMFYSRGRNTDDKEFIDSPRINGQAKNSTNGVSVYGFHDGSFLDGYYSKALDLVREGLVPLDKALSQEEIEFCTKRGYINDKGEVLNPPEKRNTVRKDLTDKPRKLSKEEFGKQLEKVSALL